MIALFTDFGLTGPYTGQMKAVLAQLAVGHPVIDLQHDAPPHDPKAAAYLLASLTDRFPPDCVFLCVVDPGVGGERAPGVLKLADQWFVGPDNGLFEMVIRRAMERADDVFWWDVSWRPDDLSASFHGRDIFAPIAARVATGQGPNSDLEDGFERRDIATIRRQSWPDDLPQVIYIDGFGNAMTGIRARRVNRKSSLAIKDRKLPYAETFSGVSEGALFWYENSCGLVEIAVNTGRAAEILRLAIGTPVAVERQGLAE